VSCCIYGPVFDHQLSIVGSDVVTYLIPQILTALIARKILDNVVNEVSEALSMHVALSAIRIVVVPAGVTVILGLSNPPRSWTGTVGPSLPGFIIALKSITSCHQIRVIMC
jgi:hypothetical protein